MSCADVSCVYAGPVEAVTLDEASGVIADVDEADGLVTCEVVADAAGSDEFEPQAAKATTAGSRAAIPTVVRIGEIMGRNLA
jgi:hypothetical protein